MKKPENKVLNHRIENIPRKSPSVIKFVKARVTPSVPLNRSKKRKKKKKNIRRHEKRSDISRNKRHAPFYLISSSSFPFFSFFHPFFLSLFLSSHSFTHSFVWFSQHMHTDTLSISLRVQMHLNLKLSRVALESYQWTLPLLENESHCRIIAFIAVFSSPKMSNSPEFYLLKKKVFTS